MGSFMVLGTLLRKSVVMGLKSVSLTMVGVMMGLAVSWLHPRATAWLGSGLAGRTLGLAGVIGIGMGLYAAMVSQLQIPEFQELMRHVRSKLTR